jgi:hypothetical protein
MLVWHATSVKMAISLLHLDESGNCVEANAKVPFEGVTILMLAKD